MRFFLERKTFSKVALWIIVSFLAVGLIATSISWYFGSEYQEDPSQEPSTNSGEASLSEEEDLQQLFEQYKTMAEEQPENVAVIVGYARVAKELGIVYLEKSNREQGEAFLRTSVENYEKMLAKQKDSDLNLELAENYQLLSEFEKAEKIIDDVLAQEPGLLKARIQKGFLLEAEKDWQSALKLWSDMALEESDAQIRAFAESRKKVIEEQLKN